MKHHVRIHLEPLCYFRLQWAFFWGWGQGGEGHLEGELSKFSRCDFIPVKSMTNKSKCLGSIQPQGTGKTVDAGEDGTCLAPGAGRRRIPFEQYRLTSCTWLDSALPGLHLDRECWLSI